MYHVINLVRFCSLLCCINILIYNSFTHNYVHVYVDIVYNCELPSYYISDGGVLCGLYCAGSFLFEKMKAENEVDVFLAARYMFLNRPQFFTELVCVNMLF